MQTLRYTQCLQYLQYSDITYIHTYITWPLPQRGFSGPIYKQVIYGWDQTSAYTGAAGSRYQSISDLTQYINEWNAAWPQHREPQHLHRSCYYLQYNRYLHY